MITRFVEVTDGFAYGKFIVARMDIAELVTPSAMPEAQPYGDRFLTHAGRRRFSDHTTLVIDAQRGTGAAWPLEGGEIGMLHYLYGKLDGLERLVCPLYFSFVLWLHERGDLAMGKGSLAAIPNYVDYRSVGVPTFTERAKSPAK